MTVVPKSGSNTLSGSCFLSGLNDNMQGTNFDAKQLSVLAAPRQVAAAARLPGIGRRPDQEGPHLVLLQSPRGRFRRRAARDLRQQERRRSHQVRPTSPDFSRQGRIDQKRKIFALRLTTQLTPKNKLSLFWDEQPQCSGAAWPGTDDNGCMSNKDGWIYGGSQINGFFGARTELARDRRLRLDAPEGAAGEVHGAATNKLLLEAGFGTYISQWGYTERPGNPTKNLVRAQEAQAQIFDRNGNRVPAAVRGCLTVGGNLKYRSSNWPTGYIFAHTWNAAASYVTGAHNMKFGYQGAFHKDNDNLFPTISNTSLMQLQFNTPCGAAGAPCPTSPIATGITLAVGRVHAKGAHAVLRVLSRRSSGPRIASRCRVRCASTTPGADSPSSRSVRRSRSRRRTSCPRNKASRATTISARESAWPTTCSAPARRRSRRTSDGICIRRRTRGGTSMPTRRSWSRRLPLARGRTTTATIRLTAMC